MLITNEYFFFNCFIILSFIFCLVLLILTYVCALRAPDLNKSTAYECGFIAFGDSRELFNIKFFIVGLLFLIFDLEILLILPWTLTTIILGLNAYFSMLIFLFLLIIGFIYEWFSGVFDFL